MRRIWVLIILFFAGLAVFMTVTLPLSFVLEKAEIERAGLSWQSASGTIWHGEVAALSYAGQPIGNVEIKARFLTFLKGGVGGDFKLAGPAGNATGSFSGGRARFQLDKLDGTVMLGNIVFLRPDIRRVDGGIEMREGHIEFEDGRCTGASGTITSDVFTKLAAAYDMTASQLTGEIACLEGDLAVTMTGTLEDGGIARFQARLSFDKPSTARVHLQTGNADLALGLAEYGFAEDATGLVWQEEFSFLEGI